jgi:hypothetical protein|tara:strand:- start:483 stop:677 length:195 start_codon:yes stop_codon:yes gene_type:complete
MEVEKVRYGINWKNFKVGYSFFIPCLDTKESWKHIAAVLKRLKYKTVHKVVIEDGVQGIRVWRM